MAKSLKHKSHRAPKKAGMFNNLEVYAFWTGFASTIISLCQVMITALK